MWTIHEMKEKGKAAFKGNYWPCVLAAFLMSLFTGSAAASSRTTDPQPSDFQQALQGADPAVIIALLSASALFIGICLLFKIFLANPLELGGVSFFTENTRSCPAPTATIKRGFQNYGHNFAVLFMRDLYLTLWTMLFIIPGLIKGYSYRMVPYILAEHPEMSANEVITLSRRMMDGHKWQAFKLDLSFLGWILLGILTLGLGLIFYAEPYMESTQAALYLKLRDQV